jgi:AraC family transcriptional regulator
MEVKSLPALRSEKTSTILFRFSKDWFNEICSGAILEALNFEHKAHFFDMKNWRIEQCLRRLGAEATSPGFATRMLAEALSVQLAIELGRHFNDDLETFRLQTVGGHISESYVSMIREYVESCENMCPKIGDIAQLCKTSSAHLRRSFKQTTGMTLHQFVAEIRLRKAQVLLAETDHPLKVISYRLGFSDPSTFSSTFGRHMKMSPSDFRNVGRG